MVSLLSVRKLTFDDWVIMSGKLRNDLFLTYEEMTKICGDPEYTFNQYDYTFFRVKIDEQMYWGYHDFASPFKYGFFIQNENMWHRFGGGEGIVQKPNVYEIEAELIEDVDPVFRKFYEWYLDNTNNEKDFSALLINNDG
jgi:hypothetical protein